MTSTVSLEPAPLQGDKSEIVDSELPAGRHSRSMSVLIKQKIVDLFAVDVRSLAVTRIAAAMVVLIDLALRSSSITAFYSDKGLLPRVALYERFPGAWSFSIHLMNGRTEIQALLFLVTGIFAFLMLVGYRTQWATFLTWLLVSSMNGRNPYVVHAGDVLLNLLLFWGMFVPWGASYSVDHALDSSGKEHPSSVVSIGTAALLLMMPFVYFFSGMLKTGPEWRDELTAIYYVLSAPEYATALGRWVANWPTPLLKALTASVVVVELSGALLLFCPFSIKTIRSIVLPIFVLFQLGLLLTLNLGLFPVISTIALMPFLSTRFWDQCLARLRSSSGKALKIYYDGSCDFCKKIVLLLKEFCLLSKGTIAPAQLVAEVHADMKSSNSWVVVDDSGMRHYKFDALVYLLRHSPVFWLIGSVLGWKPFARTGKYLYETAANNRRFLTWLTSGLKHRPITLKQPLLLSLLCIAFLAYVVVDNLGSVKRSHIAVPERLKGVGQMFKINQRWRMFAPSPLRNYEWFVTEGTLRNGQQFCMINGAYTDCRRIDGPIPAFQSYRWRTYWRYMSSDAEKSIRPYLARYICETWNHKHRDENLLDQIIIYKYQQPILPEATAPAPQKIELWSRQCLGGT